MLWPEHVLVGYLFYKYKENKENKEYKDNKDNKEYKENKENKDIKTGYETSCIRYDTRDIVIGSILPDVPMIILYLMGKDVTVIDLWTCCFYFLPHSLLVLPLVPRRWRAYYALHIFCDVLSHTGEWSIRLLYPLTNFSIPGFYDPWKWI